MNKGLENCDAEHENWQQQPRYSLLLNSHAEVRLSKYPKCQKVTHLRKFALFIHINEWGPMVLGKTYRYCSRCAMVMVQRAELEASRSTIWCLAPWKRKYGGSDWM